MSSDLGLDPSDPLNLLLHTAPDDHQPQEDESPDWSHLTTLWNPPAHSESDPASVFDYPASSAATDHFSGLSMNVDMHSFGIEPNMLHFDPTKYQQQSYNDLHHYPYFSDSSVDILSNQFPFSFQAALDHPPPDSSSSSSALSSCSSSSCSPSISSSSPESTRRLSVTSNPAHPSPPLPSSAITTATTGSAAASALSVSPPIFQSPQEAAEELAQRVRQTAGVMLAVPMTAQFAGHAPTNISTPSTPVQAKLPIPRLPRQNSVTHAKSGSPGSSYASSSSAASTPPPSTPPPAGGVALHLQPPATATSTLQMQINLTHGGLAPNTSQISSRPKTSHTTIERRYRTNLNARIQSLRMAVPALRVLEDRDSTDGKKIKRAVKGGVMVKGLPGATGIVTPGEDGTVIDVIDERGYVDGVKVARKCSKANVLGKAVEYIKVLKRREHRLRAEQAGIKALVAGLVGGPALLREWEREWRDRFGGEERDELDADELANNDGEDEDSDEDVDEDDEGGAETGRKRKRGKVASSAKIAKDKKSSSSPSTVVPQSAAAAAPPPPTPPSSSSDAPLKRKRGRPRKVPVPIPPTVAAGMPPQDVDMLVAQPEAPAVHQHHQQPQQYLLATFALFSFLNSPLASSSYSDSYQPHHHGRGVVLNHPPLVYAPEIVAGLTSATEYQASHASSAWGFGEYAQAFQLAVSVLVLLSMVMSWLRVGMVVAPSPRGNRQSWLSSTLKIRSKVLEINSSSTDGHKNFDWRKVGGQIVLKDSSVTPSLYACARIYTAVLAAKPSASLGDLSMLSLVLHGTGSSVVNTLLRARSRVVWDQAKTLCASMLRKPGMKHVHVYERLVLENMDVDDAANRLSGTATPLDKLGLEMVDPAVPCTPLQVLGAMVVRDRMKKHLAAVFVNIAAAEDKILSSPHPGAGDRDEEAGERQKTYAAAAELGGTLAQLGKIAERLCRLGGSGSLATVSADLVENLVSRDDENDEVASLLLAVILYQRVFHSHGKGQWELLSPPPSPGRWPATDPVFLLKKTLGNPVFDQECAEGLEDARDRAVDLVVGIERKRRH